jgi:hypothetical protein
MSAGGPPVVTQQASTPSASTQQSFAATAGLSFSDFGYWNTPQGASNFYANGTVTPMAQLPPPQANITASYNGTYVGANVAGTFAMAPLAAGTFTGALRLDANFGTDTIASAFTTGILSGSTSLGSPGTINPNGTYAIPNNSNLSAGGSVHFSMSGAFYGPSTPTQAPPETAGTLAGMIGTASFTGSFGAHR